MTPLALGYHFDPDTPLGFGKYAAKSWRALADDRTNGRPYLRSFKGTRSEKAMKAAVTLEVCRRDGVFDISACPLPVAQAVLGYLSKRCGLSLEAAQHKELIARGVEEIQVLAKVMIQGKERP